VNQVVAVAVPSEWCFQPRSLEGSDWGRRVGALPYGRATALPRHPTSHPLHPDPGLLISCRLRGRPRVGFSWNLLSWPVT